MNWTEADKARAGELLAVRAERVNRELERLLTPECGFHSRVREAVLYSLLAGGKRLRPGLVQMAAEACGWKPTDGGSAVLTAAAAVEMIHTYSLIHDDLPAMDNDDFRRGRPTNHKVYGEAMAVLAGDALLNHAFYVLAAEVPDCGTAVELVRELGWGAGGAGMIGGQAADILAEREGARTDRGTGFAGSTSCDGFGLLEAIHRHKTAALIRSAATMGAIAAGADPARREALRKYGENLGLAFQVVDDILDETVESAQMGKATGKDRAAGKLTYPGLLGLPAARDVAHRLTAAAVDALAPLADRAGDLTLLAYYNASRTN
jgi:geranylgeranyl diphosphate synthase type II